MKAYHFLQADFRAGRSDEGPWKIGETRIIPKIRRNKFILCQYGYHFCPTLYDALMYTPGPLATLVEVPDESHFSEEDFPKSVSYQRTLIQAVNLDRDLRLFACDCAERTLHLFEREYPTDIRPRQAIEVSRRFAREKATNKELAAARAAAWAAAWDAAWAAEVRWQRAHFEQMFNGIFLNQA